MFFRSWLRTVKCCAPVAHRRERTSVPQRVSFRPLLETLEDRVVPSTVFAQTNLVSDDTQFTQAQVQDPNLVNPWGLAASPTGAWWVANEGTATSTLYDTSSSQVSVVPLVVNIPQSAPTGTVFNGGTGFNISENGNTGPSTFLFATASGTISGWNSNVDSNNAIIGATNTGALYLGLAIATDSQNATLLYAADFANGAIDVYDQNFQSVTTLPGNFTDSQLPSNYHPFNIQAINNQLYVEYAPLDAVLAGTAALGEGAVDVYNADGQLQQRLIANGQLNQPWAVALAPSNFGTFSNDLLVGNFGDGHINAFDPQNGNFVGEMTDANNQPITITHLWGLGFGNGGAAGPTNTLYFTAGLTSNLQGVPPFHGLFGSLQPLGPAATSVVINQDISALYNAAGQPSDGVQRSMVNDIVYTFSEPVNILSPSVDPNVFTISVASGWTGQAPTLSWAPVAGSNETEWAVSFSGNGVTGGSIANGAYTMTVSDPSAITSVADSLPLVLQSSGVESATQSFYRLFGDINGDGVVNTEDNLQFTQSLTTYNAVFDINQNGSVNAIDNLKLKNDMTVNFSGFTPTI
jgi:uncharacterized protein (TIGR03118 family)